MPTTKPDESGWELVPWWTSHRFRLCIIMFFGTMIVGIQRTTFSIAIVCMVSQPNDSFENRSMAQFTNQSEAGVMGLNLSNQEFGYNHTSGLAKTEIRGFAWSRLMQGFILGSYLAGYMAMQIPAGWITTHLSSQKALCVSFYLLTVVMVLIPVCAEVSAGLVIALRIINGILHGFLFPSIHGLFSKWAAPWERSRLIGISIVGMFVGAVGFPLASVLCEYGFAGGWPSVFYVTGLLTLAWAVLATILIKDRPEDDRTLSPEEREYLKAVVPTYNETTKREKTPWVAIMTTKSVWAIIAAHFCTGWRSYLILNQFPSYLSDVVHLDISQNGIFSMLPILAMAMSSMVASVCADFFIKREILSVVNTRRLMTVIGFIPTSALLVVIGFLDASNWVSIISLLTVALAMGGANYSGHVVNHADIGLRYSPLIFGMSNMFSGIGGLMSNYLTGALTPNKTREEWQTVFYIAATVQICGCIIYLIFAKGTTRQWALPPQTDDIAHIPLRENSDKLL